MGQLIEYYIPAGFIPPQAKWVPSDERGKVIEFHRAAAGSASEQAFANALGNSWIIFAPPR